MEILESIPLKKLLYNAHVMCNLHSKEIMLLRKAVMHAYRRVVAVEVDAEQLGEPNNDKTVEMLLSLDEEESFYYSSESHVLEPAGKAACILESLEQQYGFVGGSHAEYLKYWHRSNIPTQMWKWDLASCARAIAGFTAVAKKAVNSRR